MNKDSSGSWHLYLIRCRNGSLYTGVTTDIERRFAEHENGSGAKFLRGKAPLTLVFTTSDLTHSEALRLEIAVKKLPRSEKEKLIIGDRPLPSISRP